jgi:Xaa-Pro aminopeptidase
MARSAKHQAYLPIVAYGTHASTLHYVENQTPFGRLPEGALLLVDAGCEVDNYCADITRWAGKSVPLEVPPDRRTQDDSGRQWRTLHERGSRDL